MNTQASSSKYIKEDCIYSNKFIGDNENQRLRTRSIEPGCEKRALLVTAYEDQDPDQRIIEFKLHTLNKQGIISDKRERAINPELQEGQSRVT